MRIKHVISFIVSFMMIFSMLSLCPVKAETSASEGLSNNAPSETDIVNYLKSHDVSNDYEDSFQTPFTKREDKDKCDVDDAGALSEASQQKALEYLNAMRYIAGVDPVELSSDLESKAQYSAYVNYLNDKMAHYPSKSDKMSDALFNQGFEASHSNNKLSTGANLAFYANSVPSIVNAWNMENAVDMWLSDSNDEDNWKVLGHRRWSLDPKLTEVGFGKAYGVRLKDSSMYSAHATMTYAYKGLNKSQKGLAWPAAHMPVSFFNNGDAWSYLSVDALQDKDITVTLTRKKSSKEAGQKTWTMTKTANDDGVVYTDYEIRNGNSIGNIVGHTDAVIFKPNNMDIHAGDVYNVKITGIEKTVDYDVSFFDPDHVSTEAHPVTKINLDQSILDSDNHLALIEGDSYDLSKHISIEPSDADNQDLSYSSSDETVATCSNGTIQALKAGETTITVKSDNDVTLTVSVKVTANEPTPTVSVPKGKTYTYDGEEHEVSLPDHVVYADDRYSDKTATDAGDYTYYVKPEDGYTWEDGTTDEEKIEWSITKADNSAETFEADDVTYPEKPSVKAQLKYLDDDKEIMYKEENASDDEYSTEVPTTPGTYIVKVSSEGNDNVNDFEDEKTFTIHKGTIDTSDIVMKDQNVTYDGQDHSKDMQLSGTDINDLVTLTITNQDDEQVEEAIEPGSYKVTATIHRDYYEDATKTATLTITKKDADENEWISPLTVSDDITYGDDYKVNAESKYGDVTYTYKDENGSVLLEKPTNAGTYTVIAQVEGTKAYTSLKDEKTFTIKRKQVEIPEITRSFTYDGKEHRVCEDGAHYHVIYATQTTAGSYYAELVLNSDNYEWSDGTTYLKDIYWTITKVDNSAETFDVNDVTYPEKPVVDVKLKYLDDDKKIEYKKEDASDDAYTTAVPSSPGDYDVRVTCQGSDNVNAFKATKTFTIYNATLDASGFEMSNQTVTYDGADHSHDVQVTGTDSNDEVSYEITNENGDKVASAIEPGVYNICATIHRDNYDDAYKHATLTITETGTSTGNTETGTPTSNTGSCTSAGNTGSTSPGNTGSTSTGNTGTGASTGNTGTCTPTGNTETGTTTDNIEPGSTTDNTETDKPVDNTESKAKETPIVPLSTTQAIDRMVTTLKGDRDISGSKFGLLQAKGMKVTKSSIKVQWKKIKGAKGYVIYGNKCGKKYKKLKSVKGLSWTQRKLKKGTYYKYMVVAYNAKGMAIAYSKTIHVTTLGGKKANPKNIKLKSPKKLTLKVNKKAKIKASYVLAKKAKMSNHRGLAYESSNTKVARVSKKGQITAKKKGACTIYVYGQNGTMNKVQVKVQ